MSELGDRQRILMRCISRLIDEIHRRGYECTGGDLKRDKRVFGVMGEAKGYGSPSSNHKLGCAIDINLFIDGEYLQMTEDHRPFGEYWESLDPQCRWGGRFQDGNHYEVIELLGRR
jgi:hypothetical protein